MSSDNAEFSYNRNVAYVIIQLIRLCNICYKNCFTLPMLPINAYFHSVYLVSMSLCYNTCLEKEIQLLFG